MVHSVELTSKKGESVTEPSSFSQLGPSEKTDKEPLSVSDDVRLPSAEQLENLLPLAKMAAVLSNRQKAKLTKQRNLFLQQAEALRTVVRQHIQLTGKNPLQPVLEADLKSLHAQKTSEGAADAAAIVATSPAAKSSSLTPEAEACLLAHFALQDTLTSVETAALAKHAKCSQQQVRAYFQKLRGTVHRFVERMQKKASANKKASIQPAVRQRVDSVATTTCDDQDVGATGDVAEDVHAASFAKVKALLDESGGIATPDNAGPFALVMRQEKSMEIRSRMLEAIHGTGRTATLSKLVMAGGMLETLETWAKEAEADRQTTLLLHLLRVCSRLPVTNLMLQTSTLSKTVAKLQKYKSNSVARAADGVIQHWGAMDGSYQPAARKTAKQPAHVTSVAPAIDRAAVLQQLVQYAPSTAAATPSASNAQPRSMQPLPAVRVKSNPSRPLSADEIVKAKKKAKLAAALAAGTKPSVAAMEYRPSLNRTGPGIPARQSSVTVSYSQSAPGLNLPQPPAPFLPHAPVARNAPQIPMLQDPRQQPRAIAPPRAVQTTSQGKMSRPSLSYRAPPEIAWPPDVQYAQGDESVERIVQQAHDNVEPAAVYVTSASIPPNPTEAYEEGGDTSAVHTIPFVPLDSNEVLEQDHKLRAHGVAAPQYLLPLPDGISGSVTFPPPGGKLQVVPPSMVPPVHFGQMQQPMQNNQMQYFPGNAQYPQGMPYDLPHGMFH